MTNLQVLQGDVTNSVSVDAIATLVNSGGMWFGGVDGAIMRVAGNHYHSDLARQISGGRKVKDGDVFIARGGTLHPSKFKDVIFTIDDLKLPLGELVYKTLVAAQKAGYHSVALPMMRTGVMLGVVEKTAQEAVEAMADAVRRFRHDHANSDLTIYVVVYNDANVVRMLAAHTSNGQT